MKWFSVLAVAGVCAACSGSAPAPQATAAAGTAGESAPASAPAAAPALSPATEAASRVVTPAVREVTLPAGTTLRLALTSAVGSDTSHVEDAVRAELRSPV